MASVAAGSLKDHFTTITQAWCTVQVFSSLHLLSVLKTDAAFALYLIASSLHVVSVLKADVAFEQNSHLRHFYFKYWSILSLSFKFVT